MSIEHAIVKQLLDDATTLAIVGDRVHLGRAPQGLARPHIVVEFEGADRPRHLQGSEGLVETTFTVTVVAESPTVRITLTDAVRLSLDNLQAVTKGPSGKTVYIRSVRLEDEDDDELQPPAGSDNWIWLREITFVVWHDEAVPAPT